MATHKYADLQKKYNNFVVPAWKATFNKSDKLMKDESTILRSLEVELTAGYEASACNMEFQEGVTYDSSKKSWGLLKTFDEALKLGQTVEVSLGYAETTIPVFNGLITNIELEYDGEEGFSVRVECMDAKRLMMNNYRSCQPRKDLKKYSDAVKEVLKNYAAVVGKQNISDTAERIMVIEQHNQSDYEFIVDLARRCGHSFYIIKNDVYFEPFAKDTNQLISLENKHIHAFRREMSLSDQIAEVTVRTNDDADPTKVFENVAKKFTAVGKGTKAAPDMVSSLKTTGKKTVIDTSVSSANEAKVRAEAELLEHSMKLASGSFRTVGLPELLPGKRLEIKGFGTGYDNEYYLKKVIHKFDERGFWSKGELGVNKI